MISGWPVAACVPETDDLAVTWIFKDELFLDMNFTRGRIDMVEPEFRYVERKWCRPQELAVVAIEREQSTTFGDGDSDVAALAFCDVRIYPLHEFWIGRNGCINQRAFMRCIEIPVITRQMLVIPGQLASCRIKRDC